MSSKKLNHHLEQRGDTWYLLAMADGKRIKKSLSTSSVKTARSLRDQYLKEIAIYGRIKSLDNGTYDNEKAKDLLFGQAAQEWVKITKDKVKSSTLKDYKSAMNYYILPHFGNTPISRIGYMDIESFRSGLSCSAKRKNNILVPMRAVMSFSLRAGFIDKNPMDLVKNLTIDKPDIAPLSMPEVNQFLDVVDPYYRNFFIVAFFTGMRFGEMAALKWKNVSFDQGVIKIRETRVRGEEGRPKTKGSVRDIKMLPPVEKAIKEIQGSTSVISPYVFINRDNNPLLPNSINYHTWKPALRKAGLEPRSLYQTRHTFATLMLDAGELPGWVQSMMGHESLKMILEKYYSYIKNYQRDDGSAFMEKVYDTHGEAQQAA